MSDSFHRLWKDGHAQCGCYWDKASPEETRKYGVKGDVLRECVFHAQASYARMRAFERQQAKLKG